MSQKLVLLILERFCNVNWVLKRQKLLTWQEKLSTAYGQQVPPKLHSVTSHKTANLAHTAV